jgi:uncharacterized membrane protein YjgN (DUF898 family)
MDQQNQDQSPPPFSYTFNYTGKGSELALIMFKNIFLTIITLGIYAAWGKTNTRRYLWGNTTFLGDRGGYTGTGKELFLGLLKVMGLYLVTYAGLKIVSLFVHPIVMLAAIPLYGYVVAQMIYGGLRFRLGRTTWRGVHFGLDKTPQLTKDFMLLVAKYALITVFTLGLGFPLMVHEMRLFLTNKMRFGNGHFHYSGTREGLYKIYAKALFFIPLTLGVYFFWFQVEKLRYRLEHTHFQKAHFRTNLKGSKLFGFAVGSYFLTLFTLGLATPWVINKVHALIIQSIDLYGSINFEEIDNQGSVAGDEAADAGAEEFDIDIAV